MATTIECPGGDQVVIDWVDEQGLDPHGLMKRVDIHADGSVTLHQRLTNPDGSPVYVNDQVCPTCHRGAPDGMRVATKPVTITSPTRPFPVPVEVGGL